MINPVSFVLLVLDGLMQLFGRRKKPSSPLISREVNESPLMAIGIMVGLVVMVVFLVWLLRC